MASGAHHCKDCSQYFESAQSLEVHLQYHTENLMNMWMTSDDRSREGGPSMSQGAVPPLSSSGDLSRVKSEEESNGLQNVSGAVTAGGYLKDDAISSYIKEETPSFIGGPAPLSPMDYDLKFSPGMTSPQNAIVSQGPASGSSSSVGFPQQSPSFYGDYNQQQMMPQNHQYSGYHQSSYNYDDYYNPRGSGGAPRFHPYIGRSPVPTPSPSASLSDIKDDPASTRNTPEILDLDSQEVLNSGSQSNMSSIPMWRPHEQYPSPKNISNGCPTTPVGMGVGGMQPQPSHGGSLGPSGLGPPPLGGMMPPMQSQPGYSGHTLTPQVTPPLQAPHRPTTSMSSYFSQGMSGASVMSTNTSNFTPTTSAQTPREPPTPSEYPANVKRAKSFKCEDCNKWFTSHGHLKRHYNTTLHKNMTKANNSTPTSTQPPTPDVTRPPILSPSAKSIGEASTTSSHDEESNISSSDATENNQVQFQTTGSAFQPPMNPSRFELCNNIYSSIPGAVGNPINPVIPQPQHFLGNQALQPPHPPPAAMYHGHFSTHNPTYPQQPPPPTLGHNPFFGVTNNFGYSQQGGQLGPGFHSVNDFPGPNPNDVFNGILRTDSSERTVPQSISSTGDSNSAASPEVASPDTGSEASMDSTESENNYKCKECPKTFNRMCYLTQHRSTYHEGEKPHKCTICGKRFPDETTYSDHVGKHAGEKPYKCEVCPKQFNHKTDLRRHMCLHTGEKPFSCEQCGKGFIRKDHMLKHFQTHRKKAMATTPQPASTHPSMPPTTPTLTGHHVYHPPTHPLPHPTHASGGHPHVVAAPVY